MTAPSAARTLSLEITSDTICPFCYIGYKKVTSAIESYHQTYGSTTPTTFSLRFSPFQLDPSLPPSPGKDKMERYQEKFGSPERVESVMGAMKERGRQAGIQFDFAGRVSNTLDSHRILEKAWEKGGEVAQRKVAESLFVHYFEKQGDIGDWNALAEKVNETGVMTKDETLEFLKSGELKDVVEAGVRKAGLRGITGVPYIIINGRYAVSGAQEVETFVEVFKKIVNDQVE